jgi:hypothetical protein
MHTAVFRRKLFDNEDQQPIARRVPSRLAKLLTESILGISAAAELLPRQRLIRTPLAEGSLSRRSQGVCNVEP